LKVWEKLLSKKKKWNEVHLNEKKINQIKIVAEKNLIEKTIQLVNFIYNMRWKGHRVVWNYQTEMKKTWQIKKIQNNKKNI